MFVYAKPLHMLQESSFNSAVMKCYDQVVDLKNRMKELDCDVASSTRLCQELRIAAKALEKENLQLKVGSRC